MRAEAEAAPGAPSGGRGGHHRGADPPPGGRHPLLGAGRAARRGPARPSIPRRSPRPTRAAAELARVEAEVEAERAAEAGRRDEPTDGRGAAGRAPRSRPGADRGRSRSGCSPSAPPRASTSPTRSRTCGPGSTGSWSPRRRRSSSPTARGARGRPGRHLRRRRDLRRAGGRGGPASTRPATPARRPSRPFATLSSTARSSIASSWRTPRCSRRLEKADGRFSGGRAQRRVEAARAAEQALLDELGFASYSDYMMGYSLLNVDPEKEAALDAARAELSAAEDEWQLLEAETEAELARAERMERRRLLARRGPRAPGRPVSPAPRSTSCAPCACRRASRPSWWTSCSSSLDEAGVAVAGEDLSRDELMLLAEAWLAEADESSDRERRAARRARRARRRSGSTRSRRWRRRRPGGRRSADRCPRRSAQARLSAAREADVEPPRAASGATSKPRRSSAALTAELAAAAEAERLAADAAADAEAAVAEATDEPSGWPPTLVRIARGARRAEPRRDRGERAPPVALRPRVRARPRSWPRGGGGRGGARGGRRPPAGRVARRCRRSRRSAPRRRRSCASFQDDAEPIDDSSIAEEIEWYLLARLAAQRAVCLGGSLPLLLDDALDGPRRGAARPRPRPARAHGRGGAGDRRHATTRWPPPGPGWRARTGPPSCSPQPA